MTDQSSSHIELRVRVSPALVDTIDHLVSTGVARSRNEVVNAAINSYLEGVGDDASIRTELLSQNLLFVLYIIASKHVTPIEQARIVELAGDTSARGNSIPLEFLRLMKLDQVTNSQEAAE
jgi:Arc/MetJ-type ribon-helix-helix transcriptional regulator